MIDLHCHILPGIDDGPQTLEESLALARAQVAAGVSKVLATSHVNWHYPNEASSLAHLVDELNSLITSNGIALEVLPGAEVASTYALERSAEDLLRFSLGNGGWVLIEPPFTAVAASLDEMLLELQRSGLHVLLAHPERCPAFHRDPKMLGRLVGSGMLTSVTAGALVGRFGSEVRRFALRLAEEQMIHNVASDAHDCMRRAPGMARELEQAGLTPLAGWLTEEVPQAILAGASIPARPQPIGARGSRASRSWWRRSLRRAS